MAVDFSVMQSAAAVPMRAQFTPVNVTGAIEEAYSLAGTMADTQTKMRAQQSAQNDRAAVQSYIRSGGDLFTPPGIERALTQLRGRVSPEYFTRLGEQAQKLKTADIDLQKKISGLREDELSAYSAGIESAMPFLDALQRQYEADVEAGGAESALAKFNDNRAKLVTTMQGRMAGPNTPMFNEQVVQSLQAVTPEVLPGIISASNYQTKQIKNALEAARAKAASTGKTENLIAPDGKVVANVPGVGLVDTTTGNQYTGNPAELKPIATGRGTTSAGSADTGTVTLRGSDGNQYRLNRRTGGTFVLNRETGQYTPLPGGLPAGVVTYAPGSAAEAQAAARTQRVTLTEGEAARISRITRMVKLNVPPFGQGEAGANTRNTFYKALLSDIDAQGMGDTEAAIKMAMATASRKTRENIIQRDTVLRSEEDEAKVLLGKIEDELKKIGGPASPYVREKWNFVESRLLGNPTFTNLNLYMTQFVDTMGRLSSNATGAAGTPVAYLNFAKTVLDKDFNLDQIKEFRPAFDNLLEARRTGIKNSFDYLNDLGASVPAGAAKPGGTAPGTTVAPATQAGRDQDRASILRQEYDAALQRMNTATDPTARSRAMADVRSTREELRRLGVDVPPPGEPAAAAAPAADQTGAIRDALRRANRMYEPDKFDYRIGPDGTVQQRRKAQ